MSNLKCILVLLVLLAALVFANLAVHFGEPRVSVVRRQSLVESVDRVDRIVLERRGETRTVLSHDDGRWTIVSPFVGSADKQVVLRVLDVLSAPTVGDFISEADLLKLNRTRGDFSLDVPLLTLTLSVDGREESVAFGLPTPSADGTYATVAGLEGVLVVSSNVFATVNLPTDGFRRRSLVESDAESVSGFDIRSKARTNLEFVRVTDGWTVSGGRASSEKVEKFVTDLCSSEARNFVWPQGVSNESARTSASLLAGYGLDPDSAITVSLKGGDETVDQISFGKEAADGLVYALVQNGSAIVTVPAALKDVVEQASDQFTDTRMFPLEVRSVSLFSVSAGNVLYALSRHASGLWRLESPISAPAEQSAVEAVLSRILALTSADSVEEGGVQVSVMTNSVCAQVPRKSVLGDLQFEDLRSKEMLRIDPSLVKRIVRQAGGSADKADAVLYVRDRRAWSVEKSEADASADPKGIETVLSCVAPLTALRVEKLKVPAAELDDYGLGTPSLTVAIDQSTEDSLRRNILIGKKTKGGRFATIGSSDAVFVLSDEQVRRLSTPIVEKGK